MEAMASMRESDEGTDVGMGDIDSRKKELRAELLARRNALDADERRAMDAALAAQVRALPEWASARLVCAYLSFGTEVDTRELIADAWAQGKQVALPRCIPGTREMAWYLVDTLDGLIKSKFGVDEPAEDPSREIDPCSAETAAQALVLVPGFTFDAQGFRLGYGGGFYDVFLARYKGAAVGLCRECFFDAAELVPGEFDLPVRLIATDQRIIRLA